MRPSDQGKLAPMSEEAHVAVKAITYVGPFDEAVVNIDGVPRVKHGETIDVDADVAKRLLEQPDNWQPAAKTKEEKS